MKVYKVHLDAGRIPSVLVQASSGKNAITAALEVRGEVVGKFRSCLEYVNENGWNETNTRVRTNRASYHAYAVEQDIIRGL